MKNIKVIGIGDKIISAINMIYEYCSLDIELIHINTAKDFYNELKIDNKVIIGEKTAKWVGASKDVFKGQESVVESKDKIISIFKGSDMVILVAGMGEGTGTGATPKIAEISKELGIPTIAIITKEFSFESSKMKVNSNTCVEMLKNIVDTLVIIPNDAVREKSIIESFENSSKVVSLAVKCILDNALNQGINRVIADKGVGYIGFGKGFGENRLNIAINNALNSPLLETDIFSVSSIIFNFNVDKNFDFYDVEQVFVDLILKRAKRNIDYVFNISVDESLKDEVNVTLIAINDRGLTGNICENKELSFVDFSKENLEIKVNIPSFLIKKQ